MTLPGARRGRVAWWRLAAIGLLAAGVTAALYVAGRGHQPDYTFSLFGADPVPPPVNTGTVPAGSYAASALPSPGIERLGGVVRAQ